MKTHQSIPGCFMDKMVVDAEIDALKTRKVITFEEVRRLSSLRLTYRMQCQQFIRRAMINPGAGSVA